MQRSKRGEGKRVDIIVVSPHLEGFPVSGWSDVFPKDGLIMGPDYTVSINNAEDYSTSQHPMCLKVDRGYPKEHIVAGLRFLLMLAEADQRRENQEGHELDDQVVREGQADQRREEAEERRVEQESYALDDQDIAHEDQADGWE